MVGLGYWRHPQQSSTSLIDRSTPFHLSAFFFVASLQTRQHLLGHPTWSSLPSSLSLLWLRSLPKSTFAPTPKLVKSCSRKLVNLTTTTTTNTSECRRPARNLRQRYAEWNGLIEFLSFYFFCSSWIADYSIKFDGCASIPQFDREEGIRTDLLAKFKLCPSDKCSSG